jgi:Plasmid pRiA4b ORF-3-like protein
MEIKVERRRQTRGRRWTLPWLLEGERAGPPEDCGGIMGFQDIIALFEPVAAIPAGPGDDPSGSDDLNESDDFGELDGFWEDEIDDESAEERERRELLTWLGDYHPARFDRFTANHFLVLAQGWGALED